mmetsp:Transcript_42915/g.121347  ORF Transcript_42915/g.121347 Transcript_42915/m.121347 type:complete len:422 (+) Transcript_42915:590-1855(+)
MTRSWTFDGGRSPIGGTRRTIASRCSSPVRVLWTSCAPQHRRCNGVPASIDSGGARSPIATFGWSAPATASSRTPWMTANSKVCGTPWSCSGAPAPSHAGCLGRRHWTPGCPPATAVAAAFGRRRFSSPRPSACPRSGSACGTLAVWRWTTTRPSCGRALSCCPRARPSWPPGRRRSRDRRSAPCLSTSWARCIASAIRRARRRRSRSTPRARASSSTWRRAGRCCARLCSSARTPAAWRPRRRASWSSIARPAAQSSRPPSLAALRARSPSSSTRCSQRGPEQLVSRACWPRPSRPTSGHCRASAPAVARTPTWTWRPTSSASPSQCLSVSWACPPAISSRWTAAIKAIGGLSARAPRSAISMWRRCCAGWRRTATGASGARPCGRWPRAPQRAPRGPFRWASKMTTAACGRWPPAPPRR